MKINKDLTALRAMNLLYGMSQAVFAYRVVFLQKNGLNATQIGTILCVASVIGAFAPSIGGMIADKIRSKRRIFVISLIGTALITTFVPFSASINVMGVILSVIVVPMMQIFTGSGQNMLESSSVNATHLFPGTEYSHLRVFMSIGYMSASLLYAPLMGALGINSLFFIGLIYFVSMLALSKSLRAFEEVYEEIPEENRGVHTERLNVSRIFKNYYLVIFLAINIVFAMAINCNAFITYLLQKLSIDTSMTGVAAGVRVVGELFILIFLPKIRKYVSLPMLQVLASCLFIAELSLYSVCRGITAIAAVEVLGGMGWGITLGSAVLYVRNMAPRGLETSTISFWSASFSVCGIIAMLVCGRIIDDAGIFAVYRLGILCELAWLAVFIGSYLIGKYALGKTPQMPFFPKRNPGVSTAPPI